MKIVLDCNQAGRRFSGVEVEAEPQPLKIKLTTPKGQFIVDVPEDTVLSGVLPALRAFVLANAAKIGVEVTNDGTGKKRSKVQLTQVPQGEGTPGEAAQEGAAGEPDSVEVKKKK